MSCILIRYTYDKNLEMIQLLVQELIARFVAAILDELIFERNVPLVSPNEPQKNRINRPRRLTS
jgi:hypothetical protein